MKAITRRGFLERSSALAAAAALACLPGARASLAAEKIKAITWGGIWIDNTLPITKDMGLGVDVDWFAYAQIAEDLLPQMKASWPKIIYDLAASWSPVFTVMDSEGWIESMTTKDVPNLADIPDPLLIAKNDKGVFGVPYSLGGFYWGYRKDLVEKPIRKIEDLLDPSLKGKIILPPPNHNTGCVILTMALPSGGDLRNMEAGWKFMKELAKSGNIGRVAVADNDHAVSLNTGETAVGFVTSGSWNAVKANHPVEILTRVPDSPGMKAFLYQEGFVVFKGPKAKSAMAVLNHLLKPDVNERYNAALGQGPVNRKAKAAPEAFDLSFTPEELPKFAYFPDYAWGVTQIDDWMRRWETEIQPLIRGSG